MFDRVLPQSPNGSLFLSNGILQILVVTTENFVIPCTKHLQQQRCQFNQMLQLGIDVRSQPFKISALRFRHNFYDDD